MYLEELADALQVDSSELVRTLFMKGIMLSTNSVGAICSCADCTSIAFGCIRLCGRLRM